MTNIQSFEKMFFYNHIADYLVDAFQRTILFWDALRRRGNQFREHMARETPHVLEYDFDLILDGRTLSEPVNYGLVKIKPPQGVTIDDRKRPFVVVDPRAGHGPGIGGFKADSEIGVALAAGHPCYFIGFSPIPEEGQTIESIMHAQASFLQRVKELHPKAEGKPAIIGNCQAGWAVMMLATTCPDLCGPIIVIGSPLSFWSGVHGQNPIRYTGGLMAGSWIVALLSDLGQGTFDGAWFGINFERLNLAYTLWSKEYNLYAEIDTEVARYLGLERWKSYILSTGDEIQFIVDNLFLGNKLSTAEIQTSDGMRIDLRNIRSPIICICSKGDNICPPQQALGWILDLYDSIDDIRASGQTIIYGVHESIDHLGLYISGDVAKREHRTISSNIDFIDCMPPGLYEAIFDKTTVETANVELVIGDYISRFERRTLDDIRALGSNSIDDERCFATVARVSDIILSLYRTYAQPLVRVLSTEKTAEWMRAMNPMRLKYELISDSIPIMHSLPPAAEWVMDNREPVPVDNIFWQWQNLYADWVTTSLNIFCDWRDMTIEQIFFGIYSQPWLQALVGLNASDAPPRRKPGQEPDHLAFIAWQVQDLLARMDQGGPLEALLRGLIYVRLAEGGFDGRGFEVIRRILVEKGEQMPLSEFKDAFREQFSMILLDEYRALEAIPKLLDEYPDHGTELYAMILKIATADGTLGMESKRRLLEIERLFSP